MLGIVTDPLKAQLAAKLHAHVADLMYVGRNSFHVLVCDHDVAEHALQLSFVKWIGPSAFLLRFK